MHPLIALALCSVVLAGCVGSEPSLILEPDPARDGLEGRDGPWGAARYEERSLARVDEALRYEVTYPADAQGAVAPTEGDDLPIVVMIHGGFVEVERYRWLGRHLASRGYVTLMADHDANLSLLASNNSDAALDDLLDESLDPTHPLVGRLPPEPAAAVLGHSLGGVSAAVLWADDPDRWGVLGILASFPAADTDVERFTGRPTVHLVGSEDEPEAKREQGFERFAAPRVFGVVGGMNHYAWTDDATAAELRTDGAATRAVDSTRLDAQHVLDTCLDAWMKDDSTAAAHLDDGVFSGIELSR